MWWIFALLSAFFAALTALFAKKGLHGVNSDLATAIRTIIILIISWSIVFFKGNFKSINELTQQNWIFLVLSGIATGLSWLFYFRALQLGEASQVAPIDKLSVVFVLIFAALFLREPLTLRSGIGGALIVTGAIVLAWKR